MCGRFARYSLSRELERYFNALPPSSRSSPTTTPLPRKKYPSSSNTKTPAYKNATGAVPFWAKIFHRCENDQRRVETLASKPCI